MSAKNQDKKKKTRLKKDNSKYKIKQNSCKEIEARKEKEATYFQREDFLVIFSEVTSNTNFVTVYFCRNSYLFLSIAITSHKGCYFA